MKINAYMFLSIFASLACILLAVAVYCRGKSDPVKKRFSLVTFLIGIWSLFPVISNLNILQSVVLMLLRAVYVPAIFVPAVFYDFIYHVLELNKRRIPTVVLKIFYLNSVVLVFFVFSPYFIQSISRNPDLILRVTPGIFLCLYIIYFTFSFFYSSSYLVKIYRSSLGYFKVQLGYIMVAFAIAFISGLIHFLSIIFGIKEIFPHDILVVVYSLLIAYAIVKYQLMDIRLAITKAGLFFFIYALVLGIPFWLGYKYQLWQHATWVSILLATAGPFIYVFLKKKAEQRILQEEIRTQELLSQASYGMTTIRDLQKLSKFIIDVLSKNLHLDNASIYLKNSKKHTYVLKASKSECKNHVTIDVDAPLIKRLVSKKHVIIYEEIKILSDSQPGNEDLKSIVRQMEIFSSSVIIPAVESRVLTGFIILGERKDSTIYSKDLINILSALGNQAALAIENCNYWQAESKRMQEEGLRERMTALDHMASSMAHEIDNPMHGVRTSLAFIKDFIITDPRFVVPEPLDSDMKDAIARIESLAERVSGMIKAILDYSRLGTGQLMPVKINDAVKDFLELITPQIKKDKVDFKLEVEDNLPLIMGDRIQVEEILMNFVRNSLHAVKLEEDKKISLKIFKRDKGVVRIECCDNGYGIKEEILKDIFLSSMTTKGSSEGTGLGLYRVRKIVDLFKGKVWAESEGKGMGSTLIVELPAIEGNMEEMLKNNINGGSEKS